VPAPAAEILQVIAPSGVQDRGSFTAWSSTAVWQSEATPARRLWLLGPTCVLFSSSICYSRPKRYGRNAQKMPRPGSRGL